VVERNHALAQEAVSSMQSSQGKVERGVELAQQAGESISGIRLGAKRVVEAIGRIKAALDD